MDTSTKETIKNVCIAGGFLSIIGSIAIWANKKDENAAHAERFGIFVGLWAPTFFILANRIERIDDMISPPNAIVKE